MVRSLIAILIAAAAVLVAAGEAQAVIISTADGTENTAAPVDFPYWDYISRCRNGTAVYLGNRWVLTASHVGPSSVTFAGTSYSPVSGTTIQLKNADGTLADINLFRINGDPGLVPMLLTTRAAAQGDSVTMIGAGYDRQQAMVQWDSNWQTPTQSPYYSGYLWGTSKTMRWGTNTVTDIRQNINAGYGTVSSFTMWYDNPANDESLTTSEAMAASGDSGGAVFRRSLSGNYYLEGMMFSVNGIPGQPASSAVFGDVTYAADLYKYINQLSPRDGDGNLDGAVDVADYTLWFNNYGVGTTLAQGDFNADNRVDVADYTIWFNNYGSGTTGLAMPANISGGQVVPEPISALALFAGLAGISVCRGRKATKRPTTKTTKKNTR